MMIRATSDLACRHQARYIVVLEDDEDDEEGEEDSLSSFPSILSISCVHQ